MRSGIATLTRYWLPPVVDQAVVTPKLARFYSERADYHQMTAREDKIGHPQVRLLLERIRPSHTVVEFGCGGGVVLSAAGQIARRAVGFDISHIALCKAKSRPGRHLPILADADAIPMPTGLADIAYSFEVLEHVWNPAAVLEEMIRVLKPGGTLVMTTPNGYTTNVHLPLRPAVRFLNHLGAAVCLARASARNAIYENIPPDLEVESVYPDCDMITRIHPASLLRFARKTGCAVEALETFFFLKKKSASPSELERYRRYESRPFLRWQGDHILFVARKA